MRRTGLRLRAARGHPEVQAVVRPFVRWLRDRYEFPFRVPVYLSPAPQVRTVHGDWCSASFFAPWDRRVEPYIRLATGEYPSLKRRWGRRRAAVSHLISLAHEVLHYEQWVGGRPLSERGLPERASQVVQQYLGGQRPNAVGADRRTNGSSWPGGDRRRPSTAGG